MKRRAWLLGAVAVGAGAAGAGVALWRLRASPADAIWAMRFPRPDAAGALTLDESRGGPLLLNFWATWCPPCVTELPLLDRFWKEEQAHGWRVIGLAVDQAEPVRAFLRQRPVGFPIGLAGMDGVDLSRRLGNSSGALPFSVAFDASGHATQRKLGVLSGADLASWVASVR